MLAHTTFFWPDWHVDTVRTLLLERSDPLSHGACASRPWSSKPNPNPNPKPQPQPQPQPQPLPLPEP